MRYRLIYFPLAVAILLLVAVVLGFGVYGQIYGRILDQYTALLDRAEAELGLNISYTSFTAPSLATLQLNGVTLAWRGSTVFAPSIRVRINPLRASKAHPLSFLRVITAQQISVRLSTETLTALQESSAAGSSGGGGVDLEQLLRLFGDIRVVVRDSTIALDAGPTQYVAEVTNIAAVLSERMIDYRSVMTVRSYRASTDPPPFLARTSDMQVRIRLAGQYDIAAISSDAVLRLSDVHVGQLAIRPIALRLRYQQDRVSLANEEQLRDLNIECAFDATTQRLHFRIASDGIRYDQLIVDQGGRIPIPEQLRGEYMLDFSGEYALDTGIALYDAQFEVVKEEGAVLQVALSGTDDAIVINTAVFYSALGSARLAGTVDLARSTLAGALSFNQFAVGRFQPINGMFQITDAGEGYTNVVSRDVTIGRVPIPLITIDAQLAPSVNTVSINVVLDQEQEQIASLVASNTPDTATTDIVLSLLGANVAQMISIGGSLIAQDMPFAISDVAPKLDDLHANARVEVRISDQETRIIAPFFNITDRFRDKEVFAIRFAGDSERVVADSIVIDLPQAQLVGSAILEQLTDRVYDFDLALTNSDQQYTFSARYRQDQFIRFTGTYGFSGVVLFLPQNQFRYTLRLDALPLPLANSDFVLTLDSRGEYRSATEWIVDVSSISIVESEASRTQRARLLNRDTIPYLITSSISIIPQRVSINRFVFRDRISSFDGGGTMMIDSEGAELEFAISSKQLAEEISLAGYIPFRSPEALSLTATVSALDIRHIPQNALNGTVSSTVVIARDDVGVIGNMTLTSNNATLIALGSMPIEFSATGTFTTEAIILDNIDIYSAVYHLQNGLAGYNVRDGNVYAIMDVVQEARRSLIGTAPLVIVDNPYPLISARFIASVDLYTNPDTASTQLKTAQMEIIPTDNFGAAPLVVRVLYEEEQDRYAIAGGVNNALTGYINNDRSFRLQANSEFPLSFIVRGSVTDGLVDVLVDDIFLDVENIPRLASLGFLRFTTGHLSGSIHISGSEGKIGVYGRIKSDQLGMLITYVPMEIGPLNTFLILQGNELRITETYVPVGRNQGAYFGSYFRLVAGQLSDFAVDVRTPPDTTVPFRYDFGVVDVDVTAIGNVALRGTSDGLHIDGVVRGEEGQLVARQRNDAPGESRGTKRNILNLTLSTGPRFALLWPMADFPILRVFPDLDSTIVLRTNQNNIIEAIGDVTFRGGEIFYFDRSFIIREGSLTMNVINEQFDPLIDMRAEIREQLPRGPVSIFLIVEDDFLSQLTPRLEAIPALSQAEITSVLGGNIVDTTSTALSANPLENARFALDLAGDYVSRVAVLNDFERSLREALGIFDIVTVRTQVLQNVIYDIIDISSSPSTQGIAQYFNNTDLFLGTYLADKVFLQLELGLRVDEQNEYIGGALNEVRPNTAVSLEFQSPLGVFTWNLEPQFQDSFNINSSIGLSWGLGY